MADKKIDPFDVEALEKSLNDSATRVSTIWVSYIVFGLYLVISAGNVTHRQLFLEEPIKLPVLNIDLPLVGFFFLAPVLFLILHAYILIQVLLLARTAAAYNDAVAHSISNDSYQARVRQRLANTLFAQIFAGSPRERYGTFGVLLHSIAWITLAVVPSLVLLTFEVKFLSHHSSLVTWLHRILIALDLGAVLFLWPAILDASREIVWSGSRIYRITAGVIFVLWIASIFVLSFPGEMQAPFARYRFVYEESESKQSLAWPDVSCYATSLFSSLLPQNFDRLSLPNQDFVDDEQLAKLERATLIKGREPYEGERTRSFRGRDFRCADLSGADLRRADFVGVTLVEANLARTELQGSLLDGADLKKANLVAAQLNDVSLEGAQLQNAILAYAELRGARLIEASMQGASLANAILWGANLSSARIQGAQLDSAELHGVYMHGAQLAGASLKNTKIYGAGIFRASLQGVDLSLADIRGTLLSEAMLQGAELDRTQLRATTISNSFFWRAGKARCDDAQIVSPEYAAIVDTEWDSGGTEQGKPIEASQGTIEKFIHDSTEGIEEPRQSQIVDRVRGRLSEPIRNDMSAEQAWRACAENGRSQEMHEARLLAYLVELACTEQSNQQYISRSVLKNWTWFKTLSAPSAQHLAQKLLAVDGGSCPGAADLPLTVRKSVQKFAAGEYESPGADSKE